MYEMFGDSNRLGELGEGFPLLLLLIKYISYFLLFIMVIFFIPAIMLISNAASSLGDATKG